MSRAPRTLPLALYAAATGLLEPLAPALLRRRARAGKEDAARMGERLGRAGVARPAGPLVWLHGVSVGESLSLLPLIAAFRARRPDLNILVTSGTVTSAQVLAQRLPAGVIHQFAPVDAPGAAARFSTIGGLARRCSWRASSGPTSSWPPPGATCGWR